MIKIDLLKNTAAHIEEAMVYYNSDLARQDRRLQKHLRAAVIQAFEYTDDLSHKTLKRYIEHTSPHPSRVDHLSFQDLIRTGAEQGLLLNSWDVWKKYREGRNESSHTDDEKKAEDVFEIVKLSLAEVHDLLKILETRLDHNPEESS